jgi:hypothetical protein
MSQRSQKVGIYKYADTKSNCRPGRSEAQWRACPERTPSANEEESNGDPLLHGNIQINECNGDLTLVTRAAYSLSQQNLPGARVLAMVKLASWPVLQIPKALRRLSSGHTAPCPRRSESCQISPAFKWLTSLQRRYWGTSRTKRNGAAGLSYWDCTAGQLGRNGLTTR